MSNWQSIETAPKDDDYGSFLVLTPANDMCKEGIVLQVSCFEAFMYPDHLDGCIDWNDRILNATHWMPLPEPSNEGD